MQSTIANAFVLVSLFVAMQREVDIKENKVLPPDSWTICASSISISRGRLMKISLCLRFTELSSTVILKPSCEQSPRPYPVIDFML